MDSAKDAPEKSGVRQIQHSDRKHGWSPNFKLPWLFKFEQTTLSHLCQIRCMETSTYAPQVDNSSDNGISPAKSSTKSDPVVPAPAGPSLTRTKVHLSARVPEASVHTQPSHDCARSETNWVRHADYTGNTTHHTRHTESKGLEGSQNKTRERVTRPPARQQQRLHSLVNSASWGATDRILYARACSVELNITASVTARVVIASPKKTRATNARNTTTSDSSFIRSALTDRQQPQIGNMVGQGATEGGIVCSKLPMMTSTVM